MECAYALVAELAVYKCVAVVEDQDVEWSWLTNGKCPKWTEYYANALTYAASWMRKCRAACKYWEIGEIAVSNANETVYCLTSPENIQELFPLSLLAAVAVPDWSEI
jgi:hypothetical protein